MSVLVLRTPAGSLRIERRTVILSAALLLLMLALGLVALCYGASWSTPGDVVAALLGGDHGVVIRDWRLPRVLAGMVFGIALGVGGAIFQNLTRNPMGSPDVIGLDAGAYTGTLIALTVLSGTAIQLAVGSLTGGLVVAALIYLLSIGKLSIGRLSAGKEFSGLRLVVIGIAVNAMVTALNSWIVLRAELDVAIAAVGWSAGSLNGIDWTDLAIPFAIIAILLGLIATRAHAMHQAALGEAVASTTGVGLRALRLQMVLVGVGCTALVTSVAGPIAFIALVAPQIGRRLAKASGIPLLPAALTGAVLLQGADLIAQLLLSPVSLPVGVVTTAIGGCYLIWLLTREVRRR